MLLYIIRHAHAGERGDPRYPDDALRPVSKEGRRRFTRLVKRLTRAELHPAVLATSPLVRCKQTAKMLVELANERPKIIELKQLAPGAKLKALVDWTNEMKSDRVGWVGHSPDVEEMIAELIHAAPASVRMAKGAIAAVEFRGDRVTIGGGQLRWLISPGALGF